MYVLMTEYTLLEENMSNKTTVTLKPNFVEVQICGAVFTEEGMRTDQQVFQSS